MYSCILHIIIPKKGFPVNQPEKASDFRIETIIFFRNLHIGVQNT